MFIYMVIMRDFTNFFTLTMCCQVYKKVARKYQFSLTFRTTLNLACLLTIHPSKYAAIRSKASLTLTNVLARLLLQLVLPRPLEQSAVPTDRS